MCIGEGASFGWSTLAKAAACEDGQQTRGELWQPWRCVSRTLILCYCERRRCVPGMTWSGSWSSAPHCRRGEWRCGRVVWRRVWSWWRLWGRAEQARPPLLFLQLRYILHGFPSNTCCWNLSCNWVQAFATTELMRNLSLQTLNPAPWTLES